MPFDLASLTDVGRRRGGNEDALAVLPLKEGALCVVADGMGGHLAGEVASQLTVETIRAALEAGSAAQAADFLKESIEAANRAVFREAAADAAKQGMGTTVVCAVVGEGLAQLANVGDSPAFLVRGEQARRLTEDHTWVAEELSRGAIKAEDAPAHPYRHVLTRCLGMADQIEVQIYPPVELQDGDVLVLCSDGLSEHVLPEELPGIVAGRSAAEAARALVDLANARGGSDNITVIVARWSATSRSREMGGTSS